MIHIRSIVFALALYSLCSLQLLAQTQSTTGTSPPVAKSQQDSVQKKIEISIPTKDESTQATAQAAKKLEEATDTNIKNNFQKYLNSNSERCEAPVFFIKALNERRFLVRCFTDKVKVFRIKFLFAPEADSNKQKQTFDSIRDSFVVYGSPKGDTTIIASAIEIFDAEVFNKALIQYDCITTASRSCYNAEHGTTITQILTPTSAHNISVFYGFVNMLGTDGQLTSNQEAAILVESIFSSKKNKGSLAAFLGVQTLEAILDARLSAIRLPDSVGTRSSTSTVRYGVLPIVEMNIDVFANLVETERSFEAGWFVNVGFRSLPRRLGVQNTDNKGETFALPHLGIGLRAYIKAFNTDEQDEFSQSYGFVRSGIFYDPFWQFYEQPYVWRWVTNIQVELPKVISLVRFVARLHADLPAGLDFGVKATPNSDIRLSVLASIEPSFFINLFSGGLKLQK